MLCFTLKKNYEEVSTNRVGQGSDVTSCESRFSTRTAAQARFRLNTLRHKTNFRVVNERFPCASSPPNEFSFMCGSTCSRDSGMKSVFITELGV